MRFIKTNYKINRFSPKLWNFRTLGSKRESKKLLEKKTCTYKGPKFRMASDFLIKQRKLIENGEILRENDFQFRML